jgi:hypothetical protein
VGCGILSFADDKKNISFYSLVCQELENMEQSGLIGFAFFKV